MKPVIPVLMVLVAIAIAASLAIVYLGWSLRGGGDFVAEQHPLPPFKRIAVDGLAEVTLVQGRAESLSVDTQSRHMRQVRADVRDGLLTIANNQSRHWWSDFFGGGSRPMRLTITFRELESVSASGTVKLIAGPLKSTRLKVSGSGATSLKISELDTEELTVFGSGAMKAELTGRATEQSIEMSGAGDYRAAGLASENARVTVSGAGRVVIEATKTLKIALSGAGSVEYIGNPQVTQKISGAGRVKRRDAADTVHIIASDRYLTASASSPSGP